MKEQQKNLRSYILPALIGNVSIFFLTIVDGMFVGNGVGTDALGAVNLAMPFVMIVSAISVLLNIGGVAVTAVRLGRGDTDGANQAFMHVLTAIVAAFAVLSVAGTVFAREIAVMLGSNDTFLDMVTDYVRYYSMFLLASGLLNCMSNFVRNDGEPALSTVAALTATATNIFGDWLTVYPLQMGVGGAALASGVSQAVAALVLLTHFLRKHGKLRFARVRLSAKLYRKILLRGLPEMVSQFAAPLTMFFMNRILITYLGDAAVNAFSVIGYAGSLFASLMYGLSGGLQPLFGQSYGAKDDTSLRYYFRAGMKMSLIGGATVFAVTFFIGRPVCTLFGANEAAAQIVVDAMPKYCLNFFFAVMSAVIASYLFSTKRTAYALTLNICRSLVFNTLCVNLLPRLFGYEFVWYAIAVAEGICLVIALALWRASERNGIVYR